MPSTVQDGQPAEQLVEEDLRFAAREMVKLQESFAELTAPTYISAMSQTAATVARCTQNGDRVLFCGNGRSAADARHLAAELVSRQDYDRALVAGIALGADAPVLTAISDDYGYQGVFCSSSCRDRQGGRRRRRHLDVRRSKNSVAAPLAAQEAGITTVALTGRDSRDMSDADVVLAMASDETRKVQELQLVVGHIVFALVERALFPSQT